MNKQLFFLKICFMVGAIADFLIAVNWFFISIGYNIPSFISSFRASSGEYRFAMYIATMFMLGWSVILLWGYFQPLQRRGLLIITAVLLLVSVVVELIFYQNILSGTLFRIGIIARLLLISKFSFGYFYSFK